MLIDNASFLCFLTHRDELSSLTEPVDSSLISLLFSLQNLFLYKRKLILLGSERQSVALTSLHRYIQNTDAVLGLRAPFPKTWTIYLFIKWNWNERNEICIYITPFIYRGYQSTLQTLHRNHFTTDEERAPLDWKAEPLHPRISNSNSTATSLLLANQDYLELSRRGSHSRPGWAGTDFLSPALYF